MKLTRHEAHSLGYVIDDSCYPPLAYKGPRFAPTAHRETFTQLEQQLRRQLLTLVLALEGLGIVDPNRPARPSDVMAYMVRIYPSLKESLE